MRITSAPHERAARRAHFKPFSLFTLLVLAALSAGCGRQQYSFSAVPDELIGVWRTSAPKYADRYFELQKNILVLGTGNGTAATYAVYRVEVVPQGSRSLYTIFYTVDGVRYDWSFFYDPAYGASIQFKNQDRIAWTKEPRN